MSLTEICRCPSGSGLRPDRELPTRLLHGFDRIQHEVQQDLLHLHAVGADPRQGRSELQAYRHRVSPGLRLHQRQQLGDGLLHVDQIAARGRLQVQRAQTLDDLTGPLSIPPDSLRGLARLLQVGLGALEPPEASAGIGDRRGDGLPDLVRQRRGQLAHHAQPVHVCKVRQEPLALLFRPLPILDVGQRAVPLEDPPVPVPVPERDGPDEEPAELAARAPVPCLVLERKAGGERRSSISRGVPRRPLGESSPASARRRPSHHPPIRRSRAIAG